MVRHEDGSTVATDYVVLAFVVAVIAWFGLHGVDGVHALWSMEGEVQTHASPAELPGN